MPAIDFTQVKGLEPIEDGKYEATIVSAENGVSKKGNPKIDIRWQVELGEGQKRNIFDTLTFSVDSMWRVKLTLQALGFPKDFKGDVEPEDLLGKTALITVTTQKGAVHEETGEPYPDRNKVIKTEPVTLSMDDFVS